jgi:putative chitinase
MRGVRLHQLRLHALCEGRRLNGVTKKLNGGYIGLGERKAWLTKWKAAAVPVPMAPMIILPSDRPVPPDVPKPSAKPSQPSVTNPAPGSIGAFIASIFAAIFKRKS